MGEGFAAPVVSSGNLYLFHRRDNQEILEAIDPKNGKTRWASPYPTTYRDDFGFDEGPRAAPNVTPIAVYTYGAEGALTATHPATGKRIWQRNPMRDFSAPKGYFGAAGSPLLIDGKLLLGVGAPKGAGIVAFDPATGRDLWRALDDEAGYSAPVAANCNGKSLAVFFTREGLAALDPATGAVAFRFKWRSRSQATVNAATPLVQGNQIFLTSSYGTGAVLLDVSSGQPKTIWSNDDSLSAHYATPVLDKGHLYGFHGRQEMGTELHCVEWSTGKVKWAYPRLPAGSIIYANGRLIVTLESGEVQLVEPTPSAYKKLAAQKPLDSTIRAYPAFTDGVLYLRNQRSLAAVQLTA